VVELHANTGEGFAAISAWGILKSTDLPLETPCPILCISPGFGPISIAPLSSFFDAAWFASSLGSTSLEVEVIDRQFFVTSTTFFEHG
jgi:hypothetical protein